MSQIELEGFINIKNLDSGKIIYQQKNIIVLGTKFLFSRTFATMGSTNNEPRWGVWGLMLGSGGSGGSWGASTQPDATVTQEAPVNQILRKQLSKVQYVTKNASAYDPSDTNLGMVEFQTQINATTDKLINANGDVQPIREMGLIGGGSRSAGTNPLTAGWWGQTPDPSKGVVGNIADSITLLNYKTLPVLVFPPDVTFLISWTLQF